MLCSPVIKLAAFAASLFAFAPLASAELRQGPTGVEYVKRFVPSPGPNGCQYIYTCPLSYTRSGDLGTIYLYGPLEGFINSDGSTSCRYIKSLQPPPESKIYFAGCVYGLDYQLIPARSGFVQGQSDETLNCPSSPERSLSCPNNVVTRELSPLEKVIKSRQYDPKRAKRRSSKRW